MKKFTLEKKFGVEFSEPVWERTWHDPDREFGHLREELEQARIYTGFGLRTPFAISMSREHIQTRTLGYSSTLAEALQEGSLELAEETARAVGEQICYGLHRLEVALNLPCGALFPYNIGIDRENGGFFLWSTPTAALEARNTPREEMDSRWDLPYRALETSVDSGTKKQADIFALGRVMLELLPPGQSLQLSRMITLEDSLESSLPQTESDIGRIVLRCLKTLPAHRYGGPVELATVLNPKTQLSELRIRDGMECLRDGLKYYYLGRFEQAHEHWLLGRRYDWLSVAHRNNLAVCLMREKKWNEALQELSIANQLDPSHPVVCCNIGVCHFHLDNEEACEESLRQCLAMRGDFAPAWIALSNLMYKKKSPDQAAFLATQAVCADPTSRSARWQYLRILQRLGWNTPDRKSTEEVLETLEYRVPFADFLIDDLRVPPWGRVLSEPPPDSGYGDDGDSSDDRPGDSGAPVPRRPRPSGPGANSSLPLSEYRKGLPRKR